MLKVVIIFAAGAGASPAWALAMQACKITLSMPSWPKQDCYDTTPHDRSLIQSIIVPGMPLPFPYLQTKGVKSGVDRRETTAAR